MKSVFLLSLLLSSPAFAVEVGEMIQIPRSQIQCQDLKSPPSPPNCPYCYSIPRKGGVAITVNMNLDGVEKFTGSTTSHPPCFLFEQDLGEFTTAEITQVSLRKIGSVVHRLIELNMLGIVLSGQARN